MDIYIHDGLLFLIYIVSDNISSLHQIINVTHSRLHIIIATLLGFAAYFILDRMYFSTVRSWIDGIIHQPSISHFVAYAVMCLPLLIVSIWLFKSSWLQALGFKGSIPKALPITLVSVTPMILGYYFVYGFADNLTWDKIFIGCVAAGFFEELIFRGFVFGFLFKYGKWGFIPAVLIMAVPFGVLHLHQSNDIGALFGIFLMTFMGAGLFSWLYVEWQYNLWVPIFLHFLMNLAWTISNVADNALGGVNANIFRYLTIAAVIILTIKYKQRRGEEMVINKDTLIRNVS